jgi:hypothetical protein
VRHVIQYQGPYNENIDRIRNGAQTYLKRDGSEASFRGPKDSTGVRFGLLQKHGDEGFVIARIQFASVDIPLDHPIESEGIGPNGKILSRASALSLLQRATVANPELSADIARLIRSVDTVPDEEFNPDDSTCDWHVYFRVGLSRLSLCHILACLQR